MGVTSCFRTVIKLLATTTDNDNKPMIALVFLKFYLNCYF